MPFFGVPIRNGLPIGLGSVAGFGVQQFDPSQLFAGGTVAGAWYDPSDLSTMFDTSAGTTPVAMPGQGAAVPVGAMLDKRATGYSNYFDGTGDYLTAGTTSTFNFMHNASALFTFECWVYRTVGSVDQVLFANVISSANVGAGVFISAANKLIIEIYRGVLGSFVIQHTSIATIPTNQWTHVAVTYNQSLASNNSSFYINGVLDSQATKTANAPSGSNASNAARIGILPGGTSLPFTGYISNLRIVNAVLPISLPTAPLTALTGTALLTCGTTWSGNPTITTAGNTRVDGLNPFTASPVGNHAVSIAPGSSTSRPELRARVNLLTYSEEFDNGAWTKTGFLAFGSGSVANTTATLDPIGGNTADLIVEDSATSAHETDSQNISGSAITYTLSRYIKNASGSRWFAIVLQGPSHIAFGHFQPSTNTPGAVGTSGADWINIAMSVADVGNGWYRIILTATLTVAGNISDKSRYKAVDNGPSSYAGDGTSGMYHWGADLRPANIGANVPAYQRIADADTYDTNGFPLYLRFDGLDDGMYTPANLNLTATDKVGVFAGVRKLSDATGGQVLETSSDLNANNGTFLMAFPGNIGVIGPNMVLGLRGTASAFSDARTYTAPITGVLQASFDIAQAAVADEIKQRINGAVPTSISYLNANAGTGNFGNYPLYIGSRNNSTFWLNGYLYSLAVVGSAVSAGNISAMENWVAGKTGIQI